jgi:DNA polymerase-3 subunit epsilon
MKRQVVLDTETTGLDVAQGHRVIELGCVELLNRRHSGRVLHHYIHPGREIDAGAAAVHGITLAKLAGKPRFEAVAEEFLAFVDGAELIIHNAAFDIGFLDQELRLYALRSDREALRLQSRCQVLDTLAMARELHPGQRNSLDALCKRYGIDNSHRDLHGALLDARILADVYLAMTGGQSALALEDATRGARAAVQVDLSACRERGPLAVLQPSADEQAAHERFLQVVAKASGGKALWQD